MKNTHQKLVLKQLLKILKEWSTWKNVFFRIFWFECSSSMLAQLGITSINVTWPTSICTNWKHGLCYQMELPAGFQPVRFSCCCYFFLDSPVSQRLMISAGNDLPFSCFSVCFGVTPHCFYTFCSFQRWQGYLFPGTHTHSTGDAFKYLWILRLQYCSLVLSCSGRHRAVLTHSLHIWIPSMFTGISQRHEGLVQKYNTPGFIRSISCHKLGETWKTLDMLRLLGINSAHDCAGCIQHLTIVLDQLLML